MSATGYKLSTGADLNTVFEAYNGFTQAAVTGYQLSTGDVNAKRIAKWDGATWRAMGTGANSTVRSIYAIDNLNGYVGANRVAKWTYS
jgi:hypothetical protein